MVKQGNAHHYSRLHMRTWWSFFGIYQVKKLFEFNLKCATKFIKHQLYVDIIYMLYKAIKCCIYAYL